MGKKKAGSDNGVNKTQAIKDALAKNPNASPSQLSSELTARGIEVSPGYVSTVKTSLKSEGSSSTTTRGKVPNAPAADNVQGISKSQAIKDVLRRSPHMSAKNVAAELNALGHDITPTYVRIIKSNMKTKRGVSRDKAKKPAAAVPTLVTPRESGNGESRIDVTSLVKAKSLVDQVGSIEKAQQLLALLKQLQ